MQIYYVANALYLAAFLPLVDGLRDSILNGAGGSRPETWAVTAMSVLIVATAYSLLLRASFTREGEREIRRGVSVEGIAITGIQSHRWKRQRLDHRNDRRAQSLPAPTRTILG
jgi:hypothetical protein